MRLSPVLFLLLTLSACSFLSKQPESKVVATVDGQSITLAELKREYKRSGVLDEQITKEQLSDFLTLYADFKAKLAVAKDAGYFEDAQLKQELQNYEMQYAIPFWMEKRIETELLDEYIERSKKEVNAAHILISLSPQASPADTAMAWRRLTEARNRALRGEDFNKLSLEYSTRRGNQSMGGQLGYFSVGWSVKSFEDIAYATPKDSVSMPFRTEFGYHILKVNDIRQSEPERKFSHIFMRTSPVMIDSTLLKASAVWNKVISGELSWKEAVETYSEDTPTVSRQGDIGWIDRNRFSPEFSDTVFAMNTLGEVRAPFFSGYGVHIMRLDSIKRFSSEQALREDALFRLKQLPRYKDNKEAVHVRVREIGKEKRHPQVHQIFQDQMVGNGQNPVNSLQLTEDVASKVVYEINQTNYTLHDYLTWLKERMGEKKSSEYRHFMFLDFANEKTNDAVIPMTKQLFPEFRETINDYKNGLAVFKVNEDSVWNYAKTDTSALLALYNEKPEQYRNGVRYRFYRFGANEDSVLHQISLAVSNGLAPDSVITTFKKVIATKDVIGDTDEYPFTLISSLKVGAFSEIFEFRSRKNVFYLAEIIPDSQMSFEDAYYRLVSEYQPIREEQWIQALRRRFNVTLYPEHLQ